jgi:hypothetical protein
LSSYSSTTSSCADMEFNYPFDEFAVSEQQQQQLPFAHSGGSVHHTPHRGLKPGASPCHKFARQSHSQDSQHLVGGHRSDTSPTPPSAATETSDQITQQVTCHRGTIPLSLSLSLPVPLSLSLSLPLCLSLPSSHCLSLREIQGDRLSSPKGLRSHSLRVRCSDPEPELSLQWRPRRVSHHRRQLLPELQRGPRLPLQTQEDAQKQILLLLHWPSPCLLLFDPLLSSVRDRARGSFFYQLGSCSVNIPVADICAGGLSRMPGDACSSL